MSDRVIGFFKDLEDAKRMVAKLKEHGWLSADINETDSPSGEPSIAVTILTEEAEERSKTETAYISPEEILDDKAYAEATGGKHGRVIDNTGLLPDINKLEMGKTDFLTDGFNEPETFLIDRVPTESQVGSEKTHSSKPDKAVRIEEVILEGCAGDLPPGSFDNPDVKNDTFSEKVDFPEEFKTAKNKGGACS